jgi:hypothetical protein
VIFFGKLSLDSVKQLRKNICRREQSRVEVLVVLVIAHLIVVQFIPFGNPFLL